MTDIDRERRLSAAMAELEEFCGIFGFKCEWVGVSSPRGQSAKLNIVYPGHNVVLCEFARRDYRGIGYSAMYSIAERLLSRIKRGVTLSWGWSETRPAEHGRIAISYVRKYRVPKFSSVAELKIALAAEGSEFAV